jgi:hypothetical protein
MAVEVALNIYEDVDVLWAATKTGADGRETVAGGLNGITAHFATSPSAPSLLSASFTETTASGTYLASFDTASLVAALASYDRRRLALVITKSGDVGRVYRWVRIVTAREAEAP